MGSWLRSRLRRQRSRIWMRLLSGEIVSVRFQWMKVSGLLTEDPVADVVFADEIAQEFFVDAGLVDDL